MLFGDAIYLGGHSKIIVNGLELEIGSSYHIGVSKTWLFSDIYSYSIMIVDKEEENGFIVALYKTESDIRKDWILSF